MGRRTGTIQASESGHAYQRMLLQLMLCLIAVLGCRVATAYVYVAGGSSGWVLPVEANGINFTTQAAAHSFVVGDSVVFNYERIDHTVLIVTETAFDTCNITSPLESYTEPPTTVVLNETKTWYFICGVLGHCGQGQVLKINVGGNSAAAPSPSAPTGNSSGSPTTLAPTQTAVAFAAVTLLGIVFFSV